MTIRLSGPPAGLRGSRLDVARLRARAHAALRELGQARSDLSIALVGDDEMAELNERFRGKLRPTDVLSFSLLEGEHTAHRGGQLGDVVISVETAARQAAARHRGIDEEVARLLIHGILHLLGYDHERGPEDEREMRRMQVVLWRACREP